MMKKSSEQREIALFAHESKACRRMKNWGVSGDL